MANNNSDDVLNAISNKLTVMVNLLMKKEEMSVKEKVALMDSLKLPNRDASQIIGISETHYAKEKSLLNKGKNNKNLNSNNNLGGLDNGIGTEQRNTESTA